MFYQILENGGASRLVNIGVILGGYTAAFFVTSATDTQRVEFGATFSSQSCLNRYVGQLIVCQLVPE